MFRDNLREAISRKGLVVKEAADHAKLKKRTVDNWLLSKNPTTPSADDAVKIAVALDTTVEELVDGDSGKAYILQWAEIRGARWKPPPRLQRLVEIAESLTDSELVKITEIANICRTVDAGSLPKSEAV